jgi:quercetin dioxygenase-like cupin family protein
MTSERENFTVADIAERRDSCARPTYLFAAVLLMVAAAAFMAASLGAVTTSQDPSGNQVFELPQSIGSGPGKEVSVLQDDSHLKLATLTLREGTPLTPHSAPVPATILVLEGEGVVHLGGEAVSVSKGTLLSLAGGEEHDVVPEPATDMLLLVHYLRGASGN